MKINCLSRLMMQTITALITVFMGFISSAQNIVSTYAGDGVSGLVNGDTATARFTTPFGMCADKSGNLFIADQDNNCIRKITSSGIVSTYAGSGVAGYADGEAAFAQFNLPINVCADDTGNVYVSDFQNQRIRKISVDGMVTSIAGNGLEGYADGPALAASFDYPRGICIDKQGNVYIGDSWNHRIRKITNSGEVTTYAGGGNSFGVQSAGSYLDGNDTSARFYTPCGLAIDDLGNIFVADAYNHRLRMIDPAQVVTTVAGSGGSGLSSGGFADGASNTARFNTLTEVFISQDGRIFIGDTYNQRIRMVNNGLVSTVAGNGMAGLANGVDSVAEFDRPRGVVVDTTGDHVYVCDNLNHLIRKITLEFPTGINDAADVRLKIFPNPSPGIFFIQGNFSITGVNLRNIFGKEIYSERFFSPPGTLHFENLPDGIYVLSLGDDRRIFKNEKVIIVH